jgi:hypothetical protein
MIVTASSRRPWTRPFNVTPGAEDAGTCAASERVGTARRECLDWMIPLGKRHLRAILAEWISHYNSERPHSALGPGLPDHRNPRNDPDRTSLISRSSHRWPRTSRRPASSLLAGTHRGLSFCGEQPDPLEESSGRGPRSCRRTWAHYIVRARRSGRRSRRSSSMTSHLQRRCIQCDRRYAAVA